MKKAIFIIILSAAITAALSAQIPPNWDTNPPKDTATHKYEVGISQPSVTEQDAYKNAWQDAVQKFASSIATHFQGQTDIAVQSQSFASGIEDAYTVYMETSSFSTNVPITGVSETARKIETSGGRYIARILASMAVEDYNKARQYVENDEAAFLAYRFFSQRNLFPAAGNAKPSGFDGYYSWLRNTCVIITVDDPNQNALIEQIDLFVKKLYKNAVVFAQIIDGRSARIIYDSGKYFDGILRALQNTALFTIQQQSTQLILKPSKATTLAELRAAVSTMKDSAKFVITGLETIQTQSGETANQGTIVINQFKTIASRQFNMQAVAYTVPAQYLSDSVDEDGIIRHIQTNHATFPARYLVICRSQTRLEKGMPNRIPPMVNASCHFTLYDIVTEETMHSETAQTATPVFQPSSLEDGPVISVSRDALQFLYDAKNKPGLENIMRNVFERL